MIVLGALLAPSSAAWSADDAASGSEQRRQEQPAPLLGDDGRSDSTGQVAVVIGNRGPGAGNLLAGGITARHEGVPLIALTSQQRLGTVSPSPPSTFQGQDQLDVYKPVVKWGAPIFSWDRIPEV